MARVLRPAVFAANRPLTTRDCADYMGLSLEWIRQAILVGVSADGRIVKLEAETLINTRRTNRIYQQSFVTFLIAIGWKHIPTCAETPEAALRRECAG